VSGWKIPHRAENFSPLHFRSGPDRDLNPLKHQAINTIAPIVAVALGLRSVTTFRHV